MEPRHHGRLHHMDKFRRFIKHRRHKEDKDNFDKFRGLYRNPCNAERKLRPMGYRPQHSHHAEQGNAQQRIDPGQAAQKTPSADKIRNQQGNGNRNSRNHKLFHCKFIRQPRQHHEPNAHQHAHIVHHKPGSPAVEQCIASLHSRKEHRLRQIKFYHLHILGSQKQHAVSIQVEQVQIQHLPPKLPSLPFGLHIPLQRRETLISIQRK